MAKTRGESRSERFRQMEELYVLKAYSDQEMADHLQVTRETVFKDRRSLEDRGCVFEPPFEGRHKIKRSTYISNIGLNLYQSLPLYLFARKSARQMGMAQPHVAAGMDKLAHVLKHSMAQVLAQSAHDLRQLPASDTANMVFEQVAQAWVEQRKVRIDYVRLGGTHPVQHTLSPYLIEPSVWSDAVYLVGHSEPEQRVMPYRLDRIRFASVSGETFMLPQNFDAQTLLKHAWGVWMEDGVPQPVRLRFRGDSAIQRLRESRWHPLETVGDPQADGSVMWEAPVAQWREMLPWVRGWGADVEVVEPREMRETLMGETKVMAEAYGWHVSSLQRSGSENASTTLADFFGDPKS